jgi:branched-chain amino acid transport system permease protein
VTWIIAAALACIAGTLYGLDKSFAALRLFQPADADVRRGRRGWLGSPWARLRVAIIVAFSELIMTMPGRRWAIWPPDWLGDGLYAGFCPPTTRSAVSFAILIIVLLFRPTGHLRRQMT